MNFQSILLAAGIAIGGAVCFGLVGVAIYSAVQRPSSRVWWTQFFLTGAQFLSILMCVASLVGTFAAMTVIFLPVSNISDTPLDSPISIIWVLAGGFAGIIFNAALFIVFSHVKRMELK